MLGMGTLCTFCIFVAGFTLGLLTGLHMNRFGELCFSIHAHVGMRVMCSTEERSYSKFD